MDIIAINPVSCKLLMHLPTQGTAAKFLSSGSESFLRYPGGHSEMQLVPSPARRYPFEQTQWKEPGVFSHVFAHGPRPEFSIHSSISAQLGHNWGTNTHCSGKYWISPCNIAYLNLIKLDKWFNYKDVLGKKKNKVHTRSKHSSRLTFTMSVCDVHDIPRRAETVETTCCVNAAKHTASHASRQHTLIHIWKREVCHRIHLMKAWLVCLATLLNFILWMFLHCIVPKGECAFLRNMNIIRMKNSHMNDSWYAQVFALHPCAMNFSGRKQLFKNFCVLLNTCMGSTVTPQSTNHLQICYAS